jgi:hypothetical protein
MRRLIFAAVWLSLAVLPAAAQNTTGLVVATCGTVVTAFKAGNPGPFTVDVNGNLCQSGGGGGGGAVFGPTAAGSPAANPPVIIGGTADGTATGNVANWKVVSGIGYMNLAQVNGVTVLTGAGATGTGSQRVTIAQDATTIGGSAPGTAGTPSANVVSVQGEPSMTPVQTTLPTTPTIAAGNGVVPVPSSETLGGITPVPSTSLEANHIIKAGAGNLYSFNVSADATLSGAAWWLMIYNATSAPGDGAVTPAKCYAFPSGTTSYSAAFNIPINFSTGITMGVSTTGCFTKTASAHAFISGDAK